MTPIHRLRTFVAVLMMVFAVLIAIATVRQSFNTAYGVGLTVLFSALALVTAELERWFGHRERTARSLDAEDADRVKLLADRARRDVLGQVHRAWVQPGR